MKPFAWTTPSSDLSAWRDKESAIDADRGSHEIVICDRCMPKHAHIRTHTRVRILG